MLEIEEKILDEFNKLKDDLQKWGSIVDIEIVELLKSNGLGHEIKIYPEFRLKEDKSFLSKALWRNKDKYDNPILQLEDKIGTRIVLLKSDDIEPSSKILLESKIWNSKITKSIKDNIGKYPREFSYQSFHLVVWPKEGDSKFNKGIIPLLTCEIQIRTLLQHAFAEISHDSTYKGPYKNDIEIIRALAKSMALMEATDDYFVKIFEMMTDSTKKFSCYISELTSLFLKYKPDYKKEDLDIHLTDIIFELLTKKDVTIDDLTEFITKQDELVSDAILKNNSFIFQQPIILLVYYYIHNNTEFIKKEWPLSYDTLKIVFTGFGYSLD